MIDAVGHVSSLRISLVLTPSVFKISLGDTFILVL